MPTGANLRARKVVNMKVRVSGDPDTRGSVFVDVRDKLDGTATPGPDSIVSADYETFQTKRLHFPRGVSEQDVPVVVFGDSRDEGEETARFELVNPVGAGIDPKRGIGTLHILDNADPRFGFSIVDPGPVQAPAPGETVTVRVEVKLVMQRGSVPARDLSVRFADAGTGTATSGDDFVRVPGGTLDFGTEAGSMFFSVEVRGPGGVVKAVRTIDLYIFDPRGTPQAPVIARSTATIEIYPRPSFSIGSGSVLEPPAGERRVMYIPVRKSARSLTSSCVGVRDSGRGTATSGTDYVAVEDTILTFAPDELEKRVGLVVLGDDMFEGDETVILELFVPGG